MENWVMSCLTVGHCEIVIKPLVHFRYHVVDQMLMKLGQNVCLSDSLKWFEPKSCRIEKYSSGPNLRKTLRPHEYWLECLLS